MDAAPAGLSALCAAAASIGAIHALLGPDHYLPFIALARAGRWSLARTLAVTLLCGAGHVLGSIVLGLVGVALGVAVFRLEEIERSRGAIAGWLLLAFGLAYFLWGLRRAFRNRPHDHVHVHADGVVHRHPHAHVDEHAHVHAADDHAPALTPWILFLLFVFGPCEPLIPLVMYPAARGSLSGVLLVSAVFGLTTLAAMTAVVAAAHRGLARVNLGRLERFTHAAAGLALLACGATVKIGM
jgi:sulfite exporter TauE/SafE